MPNRHTPSSQSRVYRVTQIMRTDGVQVPRVRRHRASQPQGSSERVLPWQVTMDQSMCASRFQHPLQVLVWSRHVDRRPTNSRLCELRVDYLIEDGWGPQWRPERAEIFISGNILWSSKVHKYCFTSVNINGRFTWYIISRLFHIKKCTDGATVAAPKCQL